MSDRDDASGKEPDTEQALSFINTPHDARIKQYFGSHHAGSRPVPIHTDGGDQVEVQPDSHAELARALDQLSSRSMTIRLEAMATFARLASDPEYREQILEVLTAYLRHHAQRAGVPEQQPSGSVLTRLFAPPPPSLRPAPAALRADLQAALTILGRRAARKGKATRRLDVHHTDLRGADLRGADLRQANLSRIDLSGADLRGADLRRADLTWAILDGAQFAGANLSGTFLFGASLVGTSLISANLTRAILSQANLNGADLSQAILQKAQLYGTQLDGTNLSAANLLDAANLTLQQLQAAARLTRALLPPDLQAQLREDDPE